jgi:hypothetical protein
MAMKNVSSSGTGKPAVNSKTGMAKKIERKTTTGIRATAKGVKQAKAASKPSTVQQIAKRAGITARELRDVVSSVSNVGKALGEASKKGNKNNAVGIAGKAIVNVPKQIGEVARTAVTGKVGTTASGSSRTGMLKPLTRTKITKKKA